MNADGCAETSPADVNAAGFARIWTAAPAWLFCPADRPDRYRSALDRADVVILDLEDAVAPSHKNDARRAVADLVAGGEYDHDRTVLRISGAGTPDHERDLALLEQCAADVPAARRPRWLMLAKSQAVADVERIVARLPGVELAVLLETPLGIERAGDLARADAVAAVMWGADDLVAGMGGSSSRHRGGEREGTYRDVARHARSRALIAAKAHGRAALDAVYMNIPDLDGLALETEDAAAIGFDAKVAIHPSQLSVIRTGFAPAADQIDWARRLLGAVGVDRGVTTFEGRMVDGPVYAQAERILRRAGAE